MLNSNSNDNCIFYSSITCHTFALHVDVYCQQLLHNPLDLHAVFHHFLSDIGITSQATDKQKIFVNHSTGLFCYEQTMHETPSLCQGVSLCYDEFGTTSATEEFDQHMYPLAYKHFPNYFRNRPQSIFHQSGNFQELRHGKQQDLQLKKLSGARKTHYSFFCLNVRMNCQDYCS